MTVRIEMANILDTQLLYKHVVDTVDTQLSWNMVDTILLVSWA